MRIYHPLQSELVKLVESIPHWAREYFEVRAGILEYEVNFPRPQAERLAWGEVLRLLQRHSPTSKHPLPSRCRSSLGGTGTAGN